MKATWESGFGAQRAANPREVKKSEEMKLGSRAQDAMR